MGSAIPVGAAPIVRFHDHHPLLEDSANLYQNTPVKPYGIWMGRSVRPVLPSGADPAVGRPGESKHHGIG